MKKTIILGLVVGLTFGLTTGASALVSSKLRTQTVVTFERGAEAVDLYKVIDGKNTCYVGFSYSKNYSGGAILMDCVN